MNDLINIKELKTGYLWETQKQKQVQPKIKFDKVLDTLFLYFVPNEDRVITHFVDEHVALLYRYSDKEVIGLRIESFEKSFLPKYVELQKAWSLHDVCNELENFGDLEVAIRVRVNPIAKEISRVAEPIVKKQGIELPVLV